jgi:hypothetical protein
MRIIAIAGAALALLTIPVSAQQPAPGTTLPGMKEDKPKPEESHPTVKADEKAYKSALDAIPKSKQPYDPWHNVRGTPPSNNSK